MDKFETFAEGLDHPEGAAVGPDGNVYAGGEAGQIYRIAKDGGAEVFADTGGFLYGITLDGAGNVYGCDIGRGEIVRADPSGAVTTHSSGTADRPLRIPNFAAFDDDGVLYVTDSGTWGAGDGLLFRIAPGGETTVWSTEAAAFPNGCCLTAEGDALLVIESSARRVVRVPIEASGAAGAPTVVADLTGSQPDGIALAADGTMFVGCYRPDLVWRIPPGGAPERWAEDPDGVVLNQPANPVFVGDGLGRLLLTSLGGWNLVTADPGVEGLPLRSPLF
jgi:gluconolactonase